MAQPDAQVIVTSPPLWWLLPLVAVAITVLLAFLDSRARRRVEESRFLNELDARFCDTLAFREIRQKLVDEKELDLDGADHIKVYDYLGFFEILSVFQRNGTVSLRNLDDAFGYAICAACKNPQIEKMISEQAGWWRELREIYRKCQPLQEGRSGLEAQQAEKHLWDGRWIEGEHVDRG